MCNFEGVQSIEAGQKLWSEREKQIERVITNTSGMYGDFKGLIGSALSDIDSFELGPVNDIPQIGLGEDSRE